jgi:DNA-binding beta-propeller fold protein YncE
MRKPLVVLLLACIAGTATPATAAPIDDAAAAAVAAKAAGDFAAMEAALNKALALRPLHPRWSYHLAIARAKQGATDGALILLEQVAAQGAAYQPETDPDLTSLASAPRFEAIVARFARNRAPVLAPKVAFTLEDRALIPEGLACANDGVCYVSSVRRGSITRVSADGRARPFVTPRRDGLWSALGITLDQARGLLWVASAALPELEGVTPEERGRSGVFGFALGDGRLVHRALLPDDGKPHALGDLRVLDDGRLLVSDQLGGLLYTLEPRSGAFKRLTAPGALVSPQGAVVARDGQSALVADYALGLMKVNLRSGVVSRVPSLPEISTYGIDGLYGHGDALIAVQNGLRPHRVLWLELDAAGRIARSRVLAANDPRFSEPTLGAVIGDRFRFIANSQWDRFGPEASLPPDAELAAPLVLEVALPH